MESCCEGVRMSKNKEKNKKKPHFLMQQDKNKNQDKGKQYGVKEICGVKFVLDGEVVGESGEWKTCGISWSYEGNIC